MARTPKVVEDRREHILDAAIRAFSKKGFSRTTNQDIADEASITPGLIYHYFENKQALFQAILETRSPVRLMRSLPPEMLELPPDQFLPAFIAQVLEMIEREQSIRLIRILIPEMLYNTAISELFRTQFLGQIMHFFSVYYAHQKDLGRISHPDPTFLASLTVSCLAGFILRRFLLEDPVVVQYSPAQLAEQITEVLVNGIAPR